MIKFYRFFNEKLMSYKVLEFRVKFKGEVAKTDRNYDFSLKFTENLVNSADSLLKYAIYSFSNQIFVKTYELLTILVNSRDGTVVRPKFQRSLINSIKFYVNSHNSFVYGLLVIHILSMSLTLTLHI